MERVGGRAVRLHKGEKKGYKVYSEDPVAQAREFVRQRATALHVVDLDAAFGGKRQRPLIEKIGQAPAPALVQVGGGIRDLQAAEETLAAGPRRVSLRPRPRRKHSPARAAAE